MLTKPDSCLGIHPINALFSSLVTSPPSLTALFFRLAVLIAAYLELHLETTAQLASSQHSPFIARADDGGGGGPHRLADGWEAATTTYDLQTVVAALSRVPQLATAHGGARQLRADLSRPYRFHLPAVLKHRRARGGSGGSGGGGGGGGGSSRSPTTLTPASSSALLRMGSDGVMRGERALPPPMEKLLRCAREQSVAKALPAAARAASFGEMAALCSHSQPAEAVSAEFAHALVATQLAHSSPLVH